MDPTTTAHMTYKLTDDASKDITYVDYDLSDYQRAFRGLGATYRVFKANEENANLEVRTSGIFSDFRANFNGGGATVKAEMVNDYEKGIHTVALFNDLADIKSVMNTYTIENPVVTESFVNTASTPNVLNKVFKGRIIFGRPV